MKNINGQELRDLSSQDANAVLIDVRTAGEISEGMIKDALHMDIMQPDFQSKLSDLDKSKTYFMICRSGNRSGQACMIMEQMGFDKLYNLEGGMMHWDGETV